MANSSHQSSPTRPFRLSITLLFLGITIVALAAVVAALVLLPLLNTPTAQLRANASTYDQAIQDLTRGAIPGGSPSGDIVTLPTAYRSLSPAKNGQVIIYREASTLHVSFYPRQEAMRTWVYLYASDDTPIELHGECSGLQHERPNWFLFHCP
jgi:hypothetical protein